LQICYRTGVTGNSLIAEARRRGGLTQSQLADRMGTHQSVVARWETGKTSPNFDTVLRAVRAAGFELSFSMGLTDDHDLALIRRELNLMPHERLAGMVKAVRGFANMMAASRA